MHLVVSVAQARHATQRSIHAGGWPTCLPSQAFSPTNATLTLVSAPDSRSGDKGEDDVERKRPIGSKKLHMRESYKIRTTRGVKQNSTVRF